MTQHRNPSLVKLARDKLNTIGVDQLPDNVQGPFATIAIEPYCDTLRSASRTTTGSSFIFTTPADKDFYLCGVSVAWTTDAANDSTNCSLSVTVNNTVVQLVTLNKTTLTATAQSNTLDLARPIRLDRNTSVTVGSTFAAGTARISGSIWGYTQETTT